MPCDICGRTIGHDTRCPYYMPPKSSHYCSICGHGIWNGEEYVKSFDGEYVHYDCLTDLGYREIIKWLGGEVSFMDDGYEMDC